MLMYQIQCLKCHYHNIARFAVDEIVQQIDVNCSVCVFVLERSSVSHTWQCQTVSAEEVLGGSRRFSAVPGVV